MTGSPLVVLDRVTYRYEREPVLLEVTLRISAGDFLGVVGPSGSGKTTLLKVMTGALSPATGRVDRGRISVGYVPQVETINWFFPVTVLETVVMGAPARTAPWTSSAERDRAHAVLNELGIDDLAGRHIRQLSGGQQQRVFIARALFGKPQLILLDEPTAGVDVATRHEIMHLLHELHHEGIAIVFTTHDLNGVAAHMPEILCLNKTVIAHGSPREVLTRDLLQRTYGAPMEVLIHGGMPVVLDRFESGEGVVPLPGSHHGHVD